MNHHQQAPRPTTAAAYAPLLQQQQQQQQSPSTKQKRSPPHIEIMDDCCWIVHPMIDDPPPPPPPPPPPTHPLPPLSPLAMSTPTTGVPPPLTPQLRQHWHPPPHPHHHKHQLGEKSSNNNNNISSASPKVPLSPLAPAAFSPTPLSPASPSTTPRSAAGGGGGKPSPSKQQHFVVGSGASLPTTTMSTTSKKTSDCGGGGNNKHPPFSLTQTPVHQQQQHPQLPHQRAQQQQQQHQRQRHSTAAHSPGLFGLQSTTSSSMGGGGGNQLQGPPGSGSAQGVAGGGGVGISRERRASSIHEVSADFLRLHGSRQQFRSLLSRKKLGQMPPAYTQIDCSFESNDLHFVHPSGIVRPSTTIGNHPLIRVNDAGPESPRHDDGSRLIASSSDLALMNDSQKSSFEQRSENGSIRGGACGGGGGGSVVIVGLCPPYQTGDGGGNQLTPPGAGGGSPVGGSPAIYRKRNSGRYTAPIDGTAVKMVYKIRSQRLSDRVRITDRCLALALIGILFMVADNEITGQRLFGVNKAHGVSVGLRSAVLVTTLVLLAEIVRYHINELMLSLVDCGAEDWRVVLTCGRLLKFFAEFMLCSIIPLPGTGTISWSFVESARFRQSGDESSHSQLLLEREVPLDIILSLSMLTRLYLIGRFCTLHSKQFQDASTRTLAALNRIKVNFTFVAKTALDQQPMLFLSVFLLIFWMITAWSFAQCERFGRPDETFFMLYSNALWFIAITFNGNGYGDIVPKTLFGRAIAILVGISGAVISSILIAVISRKIVLSQGQKNVNNFMNDSRLTLAHKHAAARVLQQTWRIYRCMRSSDVSSDRTLRQHQRRFLAAINRFRWIKNEIRVFNEHNTGSFQQMNRLMVEMHAHTQKLASAQDELRTQIDCLQQLLESHLLGCCNTTAGANAAALTTTGPLALQQQPLAIAPPPPPPASVREESSFEIAEMMAATTTTTNSATADGGESGVAKPPV